PDPRHWPLHAGSVRKRCRRRAWAGLPARSGRSKPRGTVNDEGVESCDCSALRAAGDSSPHPPGQCAFGVWCGLASKISGIATGPRIAATMFQEAPPLICRTLPIQAQMTALRIQLMAGMYELIRAPFAIERVRSRPA